MTKRKSIKSPKSTAARPARERLGARKGVGSKSRTDSKQAVVIALLSRPQGATIPAIIKTTGWQQHSVRGFLAGVVRKKLRFTLESEKKEEADRVYRIVTGKPDRKVSDQGAA